MVKPAPKPAPKSAHKSSSIFGANRTPFNFKQNPIPSTNKNNLFHNQPSLFPQQQRPVVQQHKDQDGASLFQQMAPPQNKNKPIVPKTSHPIPTPKPIVKEVKTEVEKKIEESKNLKLENIKVDEIGLKNLKKLNKYSKLTDTLISNERTQIKNVIEDWKEINNKTIQIGYVLRDHFLKLNQSSNFTKFDGLATKIKDIQKMIDEQSRELGIVKANLTKYV
jgi:hypothetical protein